MLSCIDEYWFEIWMLSERSQKWRSLHLIWSSANYDMNHMRHD
jgi:hypothetical protein